MSGKSQNEEPFKNIEKTAVELSEEPPSTEAAKSNAWRCAKILPESPNSSCQQNLRSAADLGFKFVSIDRLLVSRKRVTNIESCHKISVFLSVNSNYCGHPGCLAATQLNG